MSFERGPEMTVTTRKAVVKTADVQAALDEFVALFSEVSGEDGTALEIDRGPRGGAAFAVYVKGTDKVVQSFATKEDALSHYQGYVSVARDILAKLSERGVVIPAKAEKSEADKPAAKAPAKSSEKATA